MIVKEIEIDSKKVKFRASATLTRLYRLFFGSYPSQADNADDWLEQFDTFSIYQVLPQILELWRLDNATTVESKKKFMQLAGK